MTQPTPLMKQYFEIKAEYKDSFLFFQVGDFYELFFDDAKKASSFLGITLTKRGNVNGEPIPLCGVPVHSLDHYLIKLIKAGFKVAICNQLEEAVPGKVVRRGVKQVLTPGTLTDSKLLNEKSASYLFSFFPTAEKWGLLFGELLTAQLFATFIPPQAYKALESELTRFFPDEILIPNNKAGKQIEAYFKGLGYFATLQECNNVTDEQFKDWTQKINPNLSNEQAINLATLNFYLYLKKNQQESLDQFKKINFYKPEDFLIIDASTQKNLELTKNNVDGTIKNSLFDLLDKASTPMGSRMIKKWIVRPLIKHETITQRQDAVEYLIKNIFVKDKLISLLSQIGDFERVIGRISLHKAQLSDYLALSKTLSISPEIKNILSSINIDFFKIIESKFRDFSSLQKLLEQSLNEDFVKNWIIKTGFDKNLDNLRELVENSNNKILKLEEQEQNLTGINSLKIRYNQVHGYYIEITKTNLSLVPERFIRSQTLSGKERYITPELQKLQLEIEKARNEITFAEQQVFEKIKSAVNEYVTDLRKVANALANLDAIIGFANIAYENSYIRPTFNDNKDILIEDGRHPIIENILSKSFIPNSTYLTNDESLWIVTGPNMGGKSTYLRQVALICIMAQCGSFVPAKLASLPILDRIFTRIGAGDNLAEGKSTFLVEMEETANICNQATDKSLVILDEVGRGTSTFDGLAIAQAVVEHIYTNIKARCLFATHYHELTELHNKFPGIVPYHTASKKTETGILFLHKIIKGSSNGSFGIEVAKLASLPKSVITRSEEILTNLLNNRPTESFFIPSSPVILREVRSTQSKDDEKIKTLELELEKNNKIISELKNIDYNDLSPKKSFDLLWEIKKMI